MTQAGVCRLASGEFMLVISDELQVYILVPVCYHTCMQAMGWDILWSSQISPESQSQPVTSTMLSRTEFPLSKLPELTPVMVHRGVRAGCNSQDQSNTISSIVPGVPKEYWNLSLRETLS